MQSARCQHSAAWPLCFLLPLQQLMQFRPGLIERPGSCDGPQAIEGLDAGRFEPLLQEINAGSVDSPVNRVRQNMDPAFTLMMKEGHQRQFFKTKICKFWENNQCQRGSSCVYAHGAHELCETPNLEKTALCFKVLKGGSCSNPDCKFAHSVVELRASVSKAHLSRIRRVGRAEAAGRSEQQETQDTFDEVQQLDEFDDELVDPPWTRLASHLDAFGSPPGFWRQQSEDSARYSAVHSTSHYASSSSGSQATLFGDQLTDPPRRGSPTMTLSSPYISRRANQLQPQLSASIAAELSNGNFAKAKGQMLQMELLRLAPWSNSRASTRAPNSQSSGSDRSPYGNVNNIITNLSSLSNHSNESINCEQDPGSPGQHTQMQMQGSSPLPFRRQVSAPPAYLNLEAGLFGHSSGSSGMTHASPQASNGSGQFQTQTSPTVLGESSNCDNLSKAMQMELMRLAPWIDSHSKRSRAQRAALSSAKDQSAGTPGEPLSATMLDRAHLHAAALSSDSLPCADFARMHSATLSSDSLQDVAEGFDADDGLASASKCKGRQMSPSADQMSQNHQAFNVQAGLAGMVVQGGMQVYQVRSPQQQQVFQVVPAMQVLTPSEAEASPSAQFLAQELQRAMPECYED